MLAGGKPRKGFSVEQTKPGFYVLMVIYIAVGIAAINEPLNTMINNNIVAVYFFVILAVAASGLIGMKSANDNLGRLQKKQRGNYLQLLLFIAVYNFLPYMAARMVYKTPIATIANLELIIACILAFAGGWLFQVLDSEKTKLIHQ